MKKWEVAALYTNHANGDVVLQHTQTDAPDQRVADLRQAGHTITDLAIRLNTPEADVEPRLALTMRGLNQLFRSVDIAETSMWAEDGSTASIEDVMEGQQPDDILADQAYNPLGYEEGLGYID